MKENTALRQLVQDAIELLGAKVADAAKARAYDKAAGTPNGPTWVRVFQTAYAAELRCLLRPH